MVTGAEPAHETLACDSRAAMIYQIPQIVRYMFYSLSITHVLQKRQNYCMLNRRKYTESVTVRKGERSCLQALCFSWQG